MTRIPYLPLYNFASRPLAAEALRAQHTASHQRAASATSRWQAAGYAVRSDVLKAVTVSQDNPLVRCLTQWTGEGSKFLPPDFDTPQMPPRVTRTGVVGIVGTAAVYGAAHVLPVAGLSIMGIAAEISALVGLTARYAMAGVTAVGAGVFGLFHGAYKLFAWARTTTLRQPFESTSKAMQPIYNDFFGLSEKKPWPPKWETIAGLEVTPLFVLDSIRSSHTTVSETPESQVPALSVALTERSSEKDPEGEGDKVRQQIAVNKLLAVCKGDRAWASHATCVLTQSLGNVLFATLSEYPMLFQGGKPVTPCAPKQQRHNVARRDGETLVVSGAYDWGKGAFLLGTNGSLMEHGTSSPLWFKYSLTIKRPDGLSQPLQAHLEHAEWGLGPSHQVDSASP